MFWVDFNGNSRPIPWFWIHLENHAILHDAGGFRVMLLTFFGKSSAGFRPCSQGSRNTNLAGYPNSLFCGDQS